MPAFSQDFLNLLNADSKLSPSLIFVIDTENHPPLEVCLEMVGP
jgi:hypothetical protein